MLTYGVGNLFLWAHFSGIGLAIGCGIALSATGPKLATPEREHFWPLFKFLSRMAIGGVLILLATGPLLIWLKFGGTSAFNDWFWVKLSFVGLAVAGAGVQELAKMRFQRGNANARPLMMIGGRLAAIGIVGATFCAVFAFS